MKEITHGADDIDERRQIRGWKLFFLLHRLLLFRPHRGGNLPKKNLEERFRMFIEGRWVQLLIDSEACEAASSLATRRRRRNFSDTIDRRLRPTLANPILANPFLANPFFLCCVVVGFGVGKCSVLFVFACLCCVCVCVVCCVLCVVLLLSCCCCVCACVRWVC